MSDRSKDTARVILMVKLNRFMSIILILVFTCSCCSCSKDSNNDFDGTRFANTRKISVLSDSSDKELEKHIHDAVLRDCNIDVFFFPSKYYELDYGFVPDISYTENFNKVTTFYRTNAVKNISAYLKENDEHLSSLKNMLGEENIYFCSDDHSEVWYLKACRQDVDPMVTFIRKDWLDKLGLKAPSTRKELYDCLIAFRDNAEKLLGKESEKMIPFFADSEPNVSCKPLIDSFFDPSYDERTFYENGYCRTTQIGYRDALKTLNVWNAEHLLPEDFSSIRPGTKESYEPIENGYVGAFCARYDYLYINGENSHINALHKNRGDNAGYIAVNTFENAKGEYTYWQEDYLEETCRVIYMPVSCADPQACLVYLNWISNPSNIAAMKNVASVNSSGRSTLDSYLITCQGHYQDEGEAAVPVSEPARQTALSVKKIHHGNKCIRYGASYFDYIKESDMYNRSYPGSTGQFTCKAISIPDGKFDKLYEELYEEYVNNGAGKIHDVRCDEWEKVVEKENLLPR